MKNNSKKKMVIVSQKLSPNQIGELAMCCFIIKKDLLDQLHQFVVNNGGRILSAISSKGISRGDFLEMINGEAFETYTVLCTCQKEIADIFMINICREFKFNKRGHGKAFVIDILGYMGAKGPFVE